ncbi:MAG: FecR family protein, partial [Acidobacteriota bacterium]
MPTDHVDPASTPGGDPLDRLLDRVTDDIRRAEPPADLLKAAEERGWRRLAQQREAGQEIRLIGGTESGGRRRRRAAKPTEPSVRILPWAIAAGLLIAVLGAWLVLGRMAFGGPSAEVQTVDGDLFQIAGASHLPVASGDPIHEGDVVRTGRDQGAVLRLDDGSLIEMRERTELSIDEGLRGTTLRLARGSVIVEAAPQRDRKLHVETDDCLVSVVGTIFSVDHGTKGSRVSVIEGEVHVDTRRDETVLTPGMQIATD